MPTTNAKVDVIVWLIWLGVALLFAVIEVFTLDLIFLMLAGGALIGAAVAGIGLAWPWQVVVALLAAVLLLVLVRPWTLRHWRRRVPLVETNAAAYIGKTGEVLSDVTDAGGRIRLRGEVWTARAEHPGPPLPPGSTVVVLSIDGATVVVAPQTMPHASPRPEEGL